MKNDDISAFVAVVRRQSLIQAADSLQLTQSAITRRIQNLEETLGVELLDRHTKPLKPTPMGLKVFEQCLRILQEIDALRELVANDTPPKGTFRLGVPHSLSEALLLPPLRSLNQHYPALQTRVSSGWGTELLAKLVQAELDAAMILFPRYRAFPDAVTAVPLGEIQLCVVASQDTPPFQHLIDSQQHGWILNPDGCGFRDGLMRALADQGVNLQVNLDTYGSELQLGLVAEGKGLGLIPAPVLANSQYCDTLQVITLKDFSPLAELWLVYPKHLGKLQKPAHLFGTQLARALTP